MKLKTLKIASLLCFIGLIGYSQTSVPNTDTFPLQDVYNVVHGHASGTQTNLQSCFDNSVDAYFDVNYKGSKNSLYNFRNYTVMACSLPTVTTASITDITATTATGGGNVTSDGGVSVINRGVEYTTDQFFVSGILSVPGGSGTGSFTSYITGLSPSTTYYVRAFAANSIGTSYGAVYSFTTNAECILPSFIAASCGNITASSIDATATISSDGGCKVTSRGFQYSTDPTFNTILGSVTSSGSGNGQYTTTISGLDCSTQYYFRPWATNARGTYYATQLVGTGCSTLSCTYIPTVSLNTINKYGDTYATFSGSVTDDGNSAVIERGFVYSITPNPTTSSNKIISGSGVGVFSANAYGLSSSTKYYVRAYAINNVGTAYSNELDFTTLESPTNVSISTSVPVNITTSSATLGGNISSDGGNIVTERGVVYGLSINPTTSNTKIQSGNGIGIYSVNVTGLTQGTTYHVRAYAINSNGTFYGADESFITSIDGATACNAGKTFPGGQSYPSTNTIVLGSGIGDVTLTFDALSVPDFFLVEYNSITYNSGWRGKSIYDYGGISRSAFKSALWGKIDPANPSFPTTFPNTTLYPEDGYPRVNSATGNIYFTKSTNNPTTAIVKVYAPMNDTRWSYVLSCPK